LFGGFGPVFDDPMQQQDEEDEDEDENGEKKIVFENYSEIFV
jgi:hypothetical protein